MLGVLDHRLQREQEEREVRSAFQGRRDLLQRKLLTNHQLWNGGEREEEEGMGRRITVKGEGESWHDILRYRIALFETGRRPAKLGRKRSRGTNNLQRDNDENHKTPTDPPQQQE